MTDYERFGDYQPSEERGRVGLALTFLLLGLSLGTVGALLLAPESGRKTRRNLRRKYEDAMDRFDEMRDEAGQRWQRASGWATTARRKVSAMPRGRRWAE